MTAAEKYAARVDAMTEQRQRVIGARPEGDRWQKRAAMFRMDPHRPLDTNLETLASYVQPNDAVIDVGGGAGRIGLPLALRCREVVNVDPSPAMRSEFDASVAEAGITNARYEASAWPPSQSVEGDITLTANVTYFIREIVPFIDALQRAARRRVMITVWSVPPPAIDAALFDLVYGESQALAPGHTELMPVLWEMGILPDVRVMPNEFRFGDGLPQTEEECIENAVQRLTDAPDELARERVAANLDRLFERTADGYRPLWRPDSREMLITWETA